MKNFFSVRNLVFFFFLPGLIAVSGLGMRAYRSSCDYGRHVEWLKHTDEVIDAIKDIRISLTSAESSLRGYLLSGSDMLKNQSLSALAQVPEKISTVTKLTSDNPEQAKNLRELNPILSKRLDRLQDGFAAGDTKSDPAIKAFINHSQKLGDDSGPALMIRVVNILDQMLLEELRLRKSRSLNVFNEAVRTQHLIVASSSAGFLLLLFACFCLYQEFQGRKRAIKDLDESRKQAIESLSIKANFMAGMSHELRTPLHSILGMVDVLEDATDEMDRKICLTVIKRSNHLLMNLINDILDLSKIEVEKLNLEINDFNLYEWVEQTVSMVSFRASQKGLLFSFSVDPEAPAYLTGDSMRLRQILLNILGNAIKFTSEGEISLNVETFQAASGTRQLRFVIRDSGIGIASERHEEVFKLFNRLDAETIKSYGGTGLGLTISKLLVEKMGGSIHLNSALGAGSVFTIEIPEVEFCPLPINLVIARSDPRPLRLLIADDLEDNRLLIQLFLKDMPYELAFAKNGKEAVDHFKQSKFDLVILDIHMPVMSGYEASREIRKLEKESKQSRTPIVALTALSAREEVEKSLEAGCDRHFPKPIARTALKQMILDLTAKGSDANQSGLHIYLKKDLSHLIPDFIENRNREILAIREAIEAENFYQIERIAHQFRGVTGTFGFKRVSQLSTQIQTAAKEKDLARLKSLQAELVNTFDETEIHYF